MAHYRAQFLQNGMPASAVDAALANMRTSFAAMPAASLTAVLATLQTS